MNRKQISALTLLAVTGAAALASADEGAGLELGVRTGFSLPFGKFTADDRDSMSDGMSGQVPLWLDVAYRFNDRFSVGAYGQAGYVFLKHCDSPASCSSMDYRFGLDAKAELAPASRFAPWVSLGAGYEVLTVSVSAPEVQSMSGTIRGFELANLQVGADYKLSPSTAIGPFAGVSLAMYDHVGVSTNYISETSSDFSKSVHEWLTFGLRGRFDI
jgi:outer membrane protein with beta-barrel domain